MLPSLSFFRSDPCPFFKAGLCERPHCPFLHKTSSSGNRDDNSKASEQAFAKAETSVPLPLDPADGDLKPNLNGKKDVEVKKTKAKPKNELSPETAKATKSATSSPPKDVEKEVVGSAKNEEQDVAPDKNEEQVVPPAKNGQQPKVSAKNDEQGKVSAKNDEQAKVSAKNDDQAKVSAKNDEQAKVSAKNDEQAKVSAKNDDQAKVSVKNDEQQRLEEAYDILLLGSDDDEDDDDDDLLIDSELADQFLLPEDTGTEDPDELVDACYKEWLRSNQEETKSKSPTKDEKKEEPKHPSSSSTASTAKKQESEVGNSSSSPTKRRMAHQSDSSKTVSSRLPPAPKKILQSPAQVLQRRLEEARKAAAEAEAKATESRTPKDVLGKPALPPTAIMRKLSESRPTVVYRSNSDPQPKVGQFQTLPKPGQVQSPPKVGQFHTLPKLGQVQSPPKVGQFQTLPKLGQVQSPPKVGQLQTLPKLGQVRSPPKAIPTKTVSQTHEKGSTRKAHTPSAPVAVVRRAPMIPRDSITASKIPLITRQHTLEQLFKACENIYDNNDEACQRAVSEELALATKHKSKPVYVGASANCLKRLRDEAANALKESLEMMFDSTGQDNSSTSKGQVNGSVKKVRVDPRQQAALAERRSLYQAIKKYLLSPEQLTDNGFPRPHPSGDRGRITTKSRKSKVPYNGDPSKRVCDRCHKEFTIGLDGTPIIKEMCIYHHGRNFKRRVQGNFEGRYNCCDGESNSRGCTVANVHVSVHPSDEIYGFVTAVKDAGDDKQMGNDPWDVVALDCEMVYTSYGNELARATFISLDKKVLYDQLVKPIHPIIDYNTRYSGITEEMMKDVTVTLTDVQAVMLTRICPNSILIGHSLESDLMALKLKHDSVVDTSVMMPHRMGPPFKRALRTLASDHLGKIIQTGENGHDSEEDAVTALELVIWRVKEDRMIQGCGNDSKRSKY